jgi:U3 small nucleolar RNA-associated protein 12
MLLDLPGHHGEVWALAVSAYGDFVVSGSHDRSLRRWERTSEPFFVEEEKERRLESLFEADLEQQQAAAEREAAGGAGEGAAAGDAGAALPAGRRTLESVGAADAIVDALDVAGNEERKEAEYRAALEAAGRGGKPPKRPPANPLMLGLAPGAYVLRAVSGVKAGDLEQALLLLPFADALRLLGYVSGWLREGAAVELCVRAAVLLLRLHHGRLVATPGARATLVPLQRRLRRAAQGLKDALGFNVAALRHLRRAAGEAAGADAAAGVAAARRQLLGGRGGGEPAVL